MICRIGLRSKLWFLHGLRTGYVVDKGKMRYNFM